MTSVGGLLLSIIFLATAKAEPLRLILVPQQIMLSSGASAAKFDLFLYNSGDSAQVVPPLESFRALWVLRRHGNPDVKHGAEAHAFSQSIKNHTLKAHRVDHTVIDIDLSSDDGDYVELSVEIGHDEHTLTSNSVLLLLAAPIKPVTSPQATVTP
jgi:hypothetical protein